MFSLSHPPAHCCAKFMISSIGPFHSPKVRGRNLLLTRTRLSILSSLFYPPFKPSIPHGFIGYFDEKGTREVSCCQPLQYQSMLPPVNPQTGDFHTPLNGGHNCA